MGASSSAYKQPGALHTPHAYTLARCFGLQSSLLSLFPPPSGFLFSFSCLSPLCASARLVVLKRVRYQPFKVKKRGAAEPAPLPPSLLPRPYRHPLSLQPSRYRPTCNHGSGWSPRCKTMRKSRLLTSRVASAGRAGAGREDRPRSGKTRPSGGRLTRWVHGSDSPRLSRRQINGEQQACLVLFLCFL